MRTANSVGSALASALFLGAHGAVAADITLTWDTDPNATGYRVYQSTDLGANWTLAADAPSLPITVSGLPDSGLVLLSTENYNAQGVAERVDVGFYYNGDWATAALPSPPQNMETP